MFYRHDEQPQARLLGIPPGGAEFLRRVRRTARAADRSGLSQVDWNRTMQGQSDKNGPVGIALIGMGWWGKKMLSVLEAAPADIRIVRAVEPDLETVRTLCAEKEIPLSTN